MAVFVKFEEHEITYGYPSFSSILEQPWTLTVLDDRLG